LFGGASLTVTITEVSSIIRKQVTVRAAKTINSLKPVIYSQSSLWASLWVSTFSEIAPEGSSTGAVSRSCLSTSFDAFWAVLFWGRSPVLVWCSVVSFSRISGSRLDLSVTVEDSTESTGLSVAVSFSITCTP
jgi:hypothetical protein